LIFRVGDLEGLGEFLSLEECFFFFFFFGDSDLSRLDFFWGE
jgi:hypothetical protein